MGSPRYHQTGNSRPHIVQDGYRHTPRVPGPIVPMAAPHGWLARLFRRIAA